ncbi:hypothetical protein BB2000_0284 [Proteus mirabilis BB2000]|nr:hypothetical protein BB2000_0284 [Proteus mirabilis BB2000]
MEEVNWFWYRIIPRSVVFRAEKITGENWVKQLVN